MISIGYLIISFIIFLLFLIISYKKCGLKTTLSETHYCLGGITFPLAMISSACLLLPYWLENSNSNYEFLAFISASSIVLLGATPLFKDKDRKIHIYSTIVGVISSLIWSILTNWLIPLILCIILIPLSVKYKKYWALILEIGLFLNIYLTLFLK